MTANYDGYYSTSDHMKEKGNVAVKEVHDLLVKYRYLPVIGGNICNGAPHVRSPEYGRVECPDLVAFRGGECIIAEVKHKHATAYRTYGIPVYEVQSVRRYAREIGFDTIPAFVVKDGDDLLWIDMNDQSFSDSYINEERGYYFVPRSEMECFRTFLEDDFVDWAATDVTVKQQALNKKNGGPNPPMLFPNHPQHTGWRFYPLSELNENLKNLLMDRIGDDLANDLFG